MDPLSVFPTEIVHSIWNYLSPRDLLPARAVSSSWLASIGSCPSAWVTDFSNTWHQFLRVKKTLRRWKSNRVRREEITNVRDFLPTEHAYYIIYNDGTLSMFDPDGTFVRKFHAKVHSIHITEEGLLICTRGLRSLTALWNTFLTDYAMNIVEELYDIQISAAFPSGFSYRKGDDYFIRTPAWESPVPSPGVHSAKYWILRDCYVVLQGTVHTSVWCRASPSVESEPLKLQEFKASALFIPEVQIKNGPKNFYAVFARLMHFSKIYLYDENKLIIDALVEYNRTNTVLFTADFFLVYHRSLDIYPLTKPETYWSVEIESYSKIIRPLTVDSTTNIANVIVLVKNNRVLFYRFDDSSKTALRLGSFADVQIENPLGCTNQYVYSLCNGSLIVCHFELS